ncbi:hypothetical protein YASMINEVIRUS_1007 [Yasminevirus sp. GU-2018]|uniref:Uncharacterized protein n=1 Tax=Yasminevirus sp. GU-2018 TaxID=2420051 RepID=A0A5K0UAP5_9VIRU|nr:hypothetical protein YASMINEVIRUS_1007 [Yasminevirus sp. GU-2018]
MSRHIIAQKHANMRINADGEWERCDSDYQRIKLDYSDRDSVKYIDGAFYHVESGCGQKVARCDQYSSKMYMMKRRGFYDMVSTKRRDVFKEELCACQRMRAGSCWCDRSKSSECSDCASCASCSCCSDNESECNSDCDSNCGSECEQECPTTTLAPTTTTTSTTTSTTTTVDPSTTTTTTVPQCNPTRPPPCDVVIAW